MLKGDFGAVRAVRCARCLERYSQLRRGSVNFEEIIRALNDVGYAGPLSVEWDDGKMDSEEGATEACGFVKRVDFKSSNIVFDAQFHKEKQAK